MAQPKPKPSATTVRQEPLRNLIVKADFNARSEIGSFAPPERGEPPSENYLLAVSMAKEGQMAPALVKATDKGLELISGFRRYHAAKSLGWTELTIQVIPERADPELINLLENLARKQFATPDVASRVHRIWRNGTAQADIAKSVGVSLTRINQLCFVVERVSPDILNHWKERPEDIGWQEMQRYAARPHSAQLEVYMEGGFTAYDAKHGKTEPRHHVAHRLEKRRVIEQAYADVRARRYAHMGDAWNDGAIAFAEFALRLGALPDKESA